MDDTSIEFKNIKEFIDSFKSKQYRVFRDTYKFGTEKSADIYKALEDSIKVLSSILDKPDRWVISCPIYFDDCLQDISMLCENMNEPDRIINNTWQEDFETLYLACIKLYYEFDFNNENARTFSLINFSNIDIPKNIDSLLNSEHLTSKFKSDLRSISNSIVYESMKRLFHSEQINQFMNFDEKNEIAQSTLGKIDSYTNTVTEKINKFNDELNEKEQTVNSLKETLDKQKTAFNFVGLYDGFKQLLSTKIKESRVLLGLLVAMGCMMIIPLLCTIFDWLPESTLKAEEPVSHLFKLIPFISLEVLLIYFFRVILQNYKSVKGQILQIELRQTLCQFIQNYADYSKEIRTNDSHPLEKFENLIFSGIICDAENLPSTFDGMDQIGKLFSSLKK